MSLFQKVLVTGAGLYLATYALWYFFLRPQEERRQQPPGSRTITTDPTAVFLRKMPWFLAWTEQAGLDALGIPLREYIFSVRYKASKFGVHTIFTKSAAFLPGGRDEGERKMSWASLGDMRVVKIGWFLSWPNFGWVEISPETTGKVIRWLVWDPRGVLQRLEELQKKWLYQKTEPDQPDQTRGRGQEGAGPSQQPRPRDETAPPAEESQEDRERKSKKKRGGKRGGARSSRPLRERPSRPRFH